MSIQTDISGRSHISDLKDIEQSSLHCNGNIPVLLKTQNIAPHPQTSNTHVPIFRDIV